MPRIRRYVIWLGLLGAVALFSSCHYGHPAAGYHRVHFGHGFAHGPRFHHADRHYRHHFHARRPRF